MWDMENMMEFEDFKDECNGECNQIDIRSINRCDFCYIEYLKDFNMQKRFSLKNSKAFQTGKQIYDSNIGGHNE